MNKIIVILFICSISCAFELHDYHVSMCEMHFNEQSGAVEISLKMFIDDLEHTLIENGSDTLRIGTKRQSENTDSTIEEYLRSHFKIEISESSKDYNYIGSEISGDMQAIWCYLELEDTPLPKSMILTNTVLLSTFDDQTNIVQIKLPGGKQGFAMFKNGRTEETINF